MNPLQKVSSRTSLISLVAALVALTMFLSACQGGSSDTAATVGGSAITNQDVDQRTAVFEFLTKLSQAGSCAEPQGDESERAACARSALSNLIQWVPAEQYAESNDITVSDADIRKSINQVKRRVPTGKFAKRLEQSGATQEGFEAFVREALLFGKVQDALAERYISDSDLRQIYKDQALDLTTIHTQHILLNTREAAQDVYNKATAGGAATQASFGKLAKKYSKDQGSGPTGGDLGTQSASTFVDAFAKAAVKLKAGEISQPVKSQFGWHIIRMISIEKTPFEKAIDQLRSSQSLNVVKDWLDKQIAKLKISVDPRYGRWNAKNQEVVPIRSTEAPSGS